jgi:hypothetical protein
MVSERGANKIFFCYPLVTFFVRFNCGVHEKGQINVLNGDV